MTLDQLARSSAPASLDGDRDSEACDYRAFGLRIRSDIPLPELQSDSFDTPDLRIVRCPVASDLVRHESGTDYRWADEVQELIWPTAGRFRISGRNRIEIEPAPGVSDQLLAFPLLGPAMAILLHLRGRLILHASAISVFGQGVAFIGDKMAGKSTTAAAFVARGHSLLTDDVLSLAFRSDKSIEIEPAFPQIKLSAEAGRAVRLPDAEAWPEVLPGFPKRQHRLRRWPSDVVPPARIFVLRRGEQAAIHDLTAPAVLDRLMHNSYVKKFLARADDRAVLARHLDQLSTLARSAEVRVLEVPGSLERLDEAVDLVERDIARTAAAPA